MTLAVAPIADISEHLLPAQVAKRLRDLAERAESGDLVGIAVAAVERAAPGEHPSVITYYNGLRPMDLIGAAAVLQRNLLRDAFE